MEGGSAGVIHLLAGGDRDDVEALLEDAHKVFFAPGQTIFGTNDQADAMNVVLRGEAQVVLGGRFHRLTRGSVFGEMALVAPGWRMATVRAVEAMHVLKVYADAFGSLMLEPSADRAFDAANARLSPSGGRASASMHGWRREAG
jgi:CRP-like cAMP-binding protein